MKSLFRLVVLILLAGGWTLSALSIHVVRTPQRLVLLTKNQFSFQDTYVDVRQWSLLDVASHLKLIQRMIDLNKHEALSFLADPAKGDLKAQLLDAAAKGPAAPSSAPASSGAVKPPHAAPVTRGVGAADFGG